MESKDTQLPAEVLKIIKCKADDIYGALDLYARNYDHNKYGLPIFENCLRPIEQVLTEYAIMLHQEQLENIQLKRWKKEQLLVWGPLYDYGLNSGELKVGGSIPTFILERCKQFEQARQLLFRLASLVNAEQAPDEIFLTEIKTFLDGTI